MTDESVLDGPLYSAAEICSMGIPGLPKTKSAVINRARIEGWPFEERKDVGGTKRMYKLPPKYFRRAPPAPAQQTAKPTAVAGTIVSGTSKVAPALLELAIRALSEWESERGVEISGERRPAVIAILYDYLQSAPELSEGEKAMAVVLRALG